MLVDRVGARAAGAGALIAMASGSIALPFLAAMIGLPGYLIALVVITSGYATFQAANTTTVMMTATAGDRGLASGMLALSRNLGLVTGASLMGAVFALGTGTSEVLQSSARELADGMRTVFGLSATLLLITLAMVVRTPRPRQEGLVSDRG